jgi:hypothetical protein
MTTLKSMLTGIALLFVCVAANAASKPTNDKPTKDDVVNVYIDAITHGKTTDLIKYLDDDMQFNIQRGENLNTSNKDQFVEYLKQSGVNDSAAKVTTTIVQGDDNTSTMRVDFAYGDYTRSDLITLSNNDGWVITNVTSSFK